MEARQPGLVLRICISLAKAIVGSRIDYCNTFLYVIHNTYIKKLQRVQNSLACIVTQAPLYAIHPVTKAKEDTSITEMLINLQWLPVWSCIHFKINLITFKAIAQQQPPSLLNFLKVRDVPQCLRSAQATCLVRPYAGGYGILVLPTTLPNCGICIPQDP